MTLIPVNPPPPPPPPAMRIEDVILTLQRAEFEFDVSNPNMPCYFGRTRNGSQELDVDVDLMFCKHGNGDVTESGATVLIRDVSTEKLVGDLMLHFDAERSHIPIGDVLEILRKAKFKRTTENWPHSYISETKEAKVSVDVTGYYVGQTEYEEYQDLARVMIRDTATGRDCRVSLHFNEEG